MSVYETECSSLHLTCLTADGSRKHGGYYYLITGYGGTAHTAFRKRTSLIRWMCERGLSIDGELPEHGNFGTFSVIGKYVKVSHMDKQRFDRIESKEIRVLSNGDYTLGKITVSPNGVTYAHFLNPNVKSRIVFDYQESQKLYG